MADEQPVINITIHLLYSRNSAASRSNLMKILNLELPCLVFPFHFAEKPDQNFCRLDNEPCCDSNGPDHRVDPPCRITDTADLEAHAHLFFSFFSFFLSTTRI